MASLRRGVLFAVLTSALVLATGGCSGAGDMPAPGGSGASASGDQSTSDTDPVPEDAAPVSRLSPVLRGYHGLLDLTSCEDPRVGAAVAGVAGGFDLDADASESDTGHLRCSWVDTSDPADVFPTRVEFIAEYDAVHAGRDVIEGAAKINPDLVSYVAQPDIEAVGGTAQFGSLGTASGLGTFALTMSIPVDGDLSAHQATVTVTGGVTGRKPDPKDLAAGLATLIGAEV